MYHLPSSAVLFFPIRWGSTDSPGGERQYPKRWNLVGTLMTHHASNWNCLRSVRQKVCYFNYVKFVQAEDAGHDGRKCPKHSYLSCWRPQSRRQWLVLGGNVPKWSARMSKPGKGSFQHHPDGRVQFIRPHPAPLQSSTFPFPCQNQTHQRNRFNLQHPNNQENHIIVSFCLPKKQGVCYLWHVVCKKICYLGWSKESNVTLRTQLEGMKH